MFDVGDKVEMYNTLPSPPGMTRFRYVCIGVVREKMGNKVILGPAAGSISTRYSVKKC